MGMNPILVCGKIDKYDKPYPLSSPTLADLIPGRFLPVCMYISINNTHCNPHSPNCISYSVCHFHPWPDAHPHPQ